MPLNVSSLAWLNQNTDPVAVIVKALAARNAQADQGLRERALMQEASQFAQTNALRQAQAQAEQARFLQELELRRETAQQTAQQNANETGLRQLISDRSFGLDSQEAAQKAKIASMQLQGEQEFEQLVAAGMPADKALQQTISKIAFANPNALGSALNRMELNDIRLKTAEDKKASEISNRTFKEKMLDKTLGSREAMFAMKNEPDPVKRREKYYAKRLGELKDDMPELNELQLKQIMRREFETIESLAGEGSSRKTATPIAVNETANLPGENAGTASEAQAILSELKDDLSNTDNPAERDRLIRAAQKKLKDLGLK